MGLPWLRASSVTPLMTVGEVTAEYSCRQIAAKKRTVAASGNVPGYRLSQGYAIASRRARLAAVDLSLLS